MSDEIKEVVKEALKEHFGDTSPDCLVRIVDPKVAEAHNEDHKLVGKLRSNMEAAIGRGVQVFFYLCFASVVAAVAYMFGWRPQ